MRLNETKETTLMTNFQTDFHPNTMIEECDRRGQTVARRQDLPPQRFTISPRPSKTGVRLDAEAIKAACRELGITSNVRIAWSAGTRTYGCHRFSRGEHRITISGRVLYDGQSVSETLWHELQHAADSDRLGSLEFGRQYRLFSRQGYGWSRRYEANPFEQAARMRGEMGKDQKPLAWNPSGRMRWSEVTFQHEPVNETRPDWYRNVKKVVEKVTTSDELKKAKACLASTKSLLKRAIRDENWDRARHLQEKQAKDEARVRDILARA